MRRRPSPNSPDESPRDFRPARPRIFRHLGLLAACGALAWVWLVLLPELAEDPAMRRRIEHRRSAGINGNAMFYTELKVMPDVLRRVDAIHREQPEAFWAWREPPR